MRRTRPYLYLSITSLSYFPSPNLSSPQQNATADLGQLRRVHEDILLLNLLPRVRPLYICMSKYVNLTVVNLHLMSDSEFADRKSFELRFEFGLLLSLSELRQGPAKKWKTHLLLHHQCTTRTLDKRALANQFSWLRGSG